MVNFGLIGASMITINDIELCDPKWTHTLLIASKLLRPLGQSYANPKQLAGSDATAREMAKS